MTGRQSAAAGVVASRGRPLKARRVLGVGSSDLVKAFPCSSSQLRFSSACRTDSSSLIPHPNAEKNSLTPGPSPPISLLAFPIPSPHLSVFPQHLCIFLSTSPPLNPPSWSLLLLPLPLRILHLSLSSYISISSPQTTALIAPPPSRSTHQ